MNNRSDSVFINTIVNGFYSGVIVLDQQFNIICWNDWMVKYSGMDAKDVVGLSFEHLFPELINKRIHQAIENNLKKGLPSILSNILNRSPFPLYAHVKEKKDRIEQQINITQINLADPKKESYCLININNVTAARHREQVLEKQVKERKKVEIRLLKRTHQLQSALCVSNAGIFHFDIAQKQLCIDDKAAGFFALSIEPYQDVFKKIKNTIFSDDLSAITEYIDFCGKQPAGFKLEYEFRIQLVEEIKWIKIQGIIGEDNLNKNINGVLVDITRQKNDQDLLQQKQAAEMANHAKSAFLANISHELRTPMHGILSFSNLGITRASSESTEKLMSYFSRIHESGERLLYLLNDLLDLSKLEAGQMKMKFARYNLLSLVEQVINEQSARIDTLDIQMECQCQEGATEGEFDNVRITQVITNLFSNAIKYTPKGCKIIFVIKQTKDELELTVTDFGIGIPEQEMDHIFEKFQQSSETEDGSGGIGLGLAICKEIIDAHHGVIGVRNNKLEGASFYFKIPLRQIDA